MNYLKKYSDFLKIFLKPKTKIKVVFDCSNGPTSLVLNKIFKGKGLVEAILINSRVDGGFPAHSPNPLARGSRKDLAKAVLKHKADLGVIFDADGDRALFISDKGSEIEVDAVIKLMIEYLRPRKVVLDITVGFLARDKDNLPFKFHIFNSRVGTYFMESAMMSRRADFGAERSGHCYFKKFYYSGSGILSAITMINIVSVMKKRGVLISDWMRDLPHYYSLENYSLRASEPTSTIRKLRVILKRRRRGFNSVDGITLKGRGFWWNVRASNTESLLRVRLEAITPEIFKKESGALVRLLKEAGLKITIQR